MQPVLLLLMIAIVAGVFFVHRAAGVRLRFFVGGLACLILWSVFLIFVPGGRSMSAWWLPLDAPLNFGWMAFWAGPLAWPQLQLISSNCSRIAERVRGWRRLIAEARDNRSHE